LDAVIKLLMTFLTNEKLLTIMQCTEIKTLGLYTNSEWNYYHKCAVHINQSIV